MPEGKFYSLFSSLVVQHWRRRGRGSTMQQAVSKLIGAARHDGKNKPPMVTDKDDARQPCVLAPLIYRRAISLPGKYAVGSWSTGGHSLWHGKYMVRSWSRLIAKQGTVSSGRGLSSRMPGSCRQMDGVTNWVILSTGQYSVVEVLTPTDRKQ